MFERHYRNDDENIQVNENNLFRIGSRAFWHNSFYNRIADGKEHADREHIKIKSGQNLMQILSEEPGVFQVRIVNQPTLDKEPILVTQFSAYDSTDKTIIPMNTCPGQNGVTKTHEELRKNKDIVEEFIRLRDREHKQKSICSEITMTQIN